MNDENAVIQLYYSQLAPLDFLQRNALLEERLQAQRYRQTADQQRFLTARLLTRKAAAQLLICTANDLEIQKTEHGAPFLAWRNQKNTALLPQMNLTHSGNWVAVAFCWRSSVGVDLESQSACNFSEFKEIAFSEAEKRSPPKCTLAQLWTAKEAVTKVLKTGLFFAPQQFSLSIQDDSFSTQLDNRPVISGKWFFIDDIFSLAVAKEGNLATVKIQHFYF